MSDMSSAARRQTFGRDSLTDVRQETAESHVGRRYGRTALHQRQRKVFVERHSQKFGVFPMDQRRERPRGRMRVRIQQQCRHIRRGRALEQPVHRRPHDESRHLTAADEAPCIGGRAAGERTDQRGAVGAEVGAIQSAGLRQFPVGQRNDVAVGSRGVGGRRKVAETQRRIGEKAEPYPALFVRRCISNRTYDSLRWTLALRCLR